MYKHAIVYFGSIIQLLLYYDRAANMAHQRDDSRRFD